MEKIPKEELLRRSKIPGINAVKMHKFYKGKTQVISRCQVRDFNDFSIWYTPGVAAPSKEIYADKRKVYDYTSKWNTIAVVSDGSRVLGLGNIGPEAGLPVMEGKAILFKYLGGVDAVPLCIGKDGGCEAQDIIDFVKMIQPTFGGINLEDIEKPKCFTVLDTLRTDPEVTIPVWHDDQQGTACVNLAGLTNALKIVGKKKNEIKIVLNGIGAANFATHRVLRCDGFDLKNFLFVDTKGILYKGREDLECPGNYKCELVERSNPDQLRGDLSIALEGADVMISSTTPGPDVIKKEWISKMADDAIVFVLANPIPEIFPWDAIEAGARIVATGRSDFPNQVNNSLGFPGIFRGTLDVYARTITDEMCVAAAHALANFMEKIEGGLTESSIIPTMDYKEAFIDEAVATGLKAIEQGIARVKLSEEELRNNALNLINSSQSQLKVLMEKGYIPEFTDYEK